MLGAMPNYTLRHDLLPNFRVDLQAVGVAVSPLGIEKLKQRATALAIGIFDTVHHTASGIELLGGLAGYDAVSRVVGRQSLLNFALDLYPPHVESKLCLG